MGPAARLSVLVELGFLNAETARLAVPLARDLTGADHPEAVYAEARDIVLDAAEDSPPGAL